MEGGGESVIAVVRGSKTAALTVTLLPDARRASTRKCGDSNRKSTRVTHSSAETNTERNFGNVHNVPIYDGGYASSYGFTDYQTPALSAIPQHIGSMFKGPDLFTQSLRKYPLDRSSAEFIQRIIDYTRTKKSDKKRYPRCLRTLLRKTISQTQAANSHEISANGKYEGKRRDILNKDLSQNELVNYTYDYLKSSSLVPRNTDVRFLTDMKRAVRGTLRCMADEEPAICPQMRRRYSHHRQYYHNDKDTINKVRGTDEATRNAAPKTVSIGVTSLRRNASSNINCQSECKQCQSPCDWDDKKSEELLNKSQDTETQIFVNEIKGWLNTIPVYENFNRNERARRQELTEEMAKTLKNLLKDINFPTLAKKEIIKYLEILPMWRPGDSEYEGILVEQIADDLIIRLNNLAEVNFKTAISDEVKNLPFDKEIINDDIIKKTIDTLVDKLTAVSLNRLKSDEEYKKMLKTEVINIIEDLPLKSDQQNHQQKQSLADKIVERLYKNKIFNVENKPAVIEHTKKTLFDWCSEIPELSNHSATQYSDLVQSLADKFHPFEACDIKYDNCIRELREDIYKWLDDIAARLNTNFSSERKSKLCNELMERLLDATIIEQVIKWSKNIPELSVFNSIETNRDLKNLGFQLKDVLNNYNDIENIRSNMKDIISKWFNHILQSKHIQLDSKTQDNLLNDLIMKLTDVSARKKELIHRDLVTWLKEIPYTKPLDNLETNNLVREFVIGLVEVQTTNKDIETDIEDKIKKFVQQLSAANDTNITSEYIDKLKSNVSKRLKKSATDCFSGEISNILESCSMFTKEQKIKINNKITSTILRHVSDTSVNWDQVYSKLVNILTQETQLNKNVIEELAIRITERVKYILLKNTVKEECNTSSKTCNICKNLETQKSYKKYLEERLLNSNNTQDVKSRVHDNFNDIPENSIGKRNTLMDETHSGNLAILRNIDLASQNFDQKIQKRKTVNSTQTNTINNNNNVNKTYNTNIQDNKTTIENENRQSFLENNFSTSTPISSIIKYPSLTSVGPSATINNHFINKRNLNPDEALEHSQYLSKIKNIINDWLGKFDMIMNSNEKNMFIDNIASDIINRQNYLKLSGNSTCENDELEHLKYQIFKRLHNKVDQDVLRDIISNVNCLNRIISLKLSKSEQSATIHKPDETKDLPMISIRADNSIVQKIIKWYNQYLPQFKLNNIKHRKDKIEELGRRLEMLKINGNYVKNHIQKEIFQWLTSILNNTDGTNINDLTESLTIYLNDFNELETYITQQDTSQFVFENLSGAIVDWFRITQYRNKLQNRIQSYFASMLADDIKEVFAKGVHLSCDELNKLLTGEIIKNLCKVTGDLDDSASYYETACDLLKYLQDLKLFHDISERKTTSETCNKICEDEDLMYENEKKEVVIKWLKRLPLEEGKMLTDMLDEVEFFFENLVKYSELNILNNENQLRQQIIRFLSKIPLKINDEGYSGIENLAATLTAMMKDIYVQKHATTDETKRNTINNTTVHESPDLVYKKLLYDTISKTFFEKCTTEEQLSFNVLKDKLADAFIDLHYSTDSEKMRIVFKNKLYKEITKFCDDYVKSRSIVPLCGNILQENLHKVLTNVSLPTIQSNLDISKDKIIEEIFKCIKDIPVSGVLVSNLVNRIYPVLNERELNNDNIEEIKNEIINWLQSIPLQSDNVLNIDETVNNLIEKLKVQAKFKNVSPKEQSVNNAPMKETHDYTNHSSNTLSTDEIEHLKIIRARSDIPTTNDEYLAIKDIGNQTDINYTITGDVETNTTTHKSSINKEISPQVIVKEYVWDSSIASNQMVPPLTTSESQTESYSKYEMKSQRPSISKKQNILEPRSREVSITIETQTQITDDLHQKIRPVLKSQLCQAQNTNSSENPQSRQKPCCRMNEYGAGLSCRETLETETMRHLEPFKEDLLKQSKTTTPVLITEKTSERRCYLSPECEMRKSKADNTCCSCKNHLTTKCRNNTYICCRRQITNNRHCSTCFGGNCPHPSSFFFKRDL